MIASPLGARKRQAEAARAQRSEAAHAAQADRLVRNLSGEDSEVRAQGSYVDLGDSARMAVLLCPEGRGTFKEQVNDVLSLLATSLEGRPHPLEATLLTVFLREPRDRDEAGRLLAEYFGARMPVTNYVLQPPCNGAAVAMEVWAVGGGDVRIEHFGPQVLTVTYDGLRWIYCGGIESPASVSGVYQQTTGGIKALEAALRLAGSGLEDVVRTWYYLGGINAVEGELERYKEFNRARTDAYREVDFCRGIPGVRGPGAVLPASTGIGMRGGGLILSSLGLQTRRQDISLFPLENPLQVPAYQYPPTYSPESPKFSRAMALGLGHYVTSWISGTASIVNSESLYPGDIARQTMQTLDNIERLIAPENCAAHGFPQAGARLDDLAKVRVYIKRPEDYARCKSVCEERLGKVPVLYLVADVCRPELLVEIEGVAFSRLRTQVSG
ncbi:MAG TPA: dioxygenase [Verrucomicrobiota bacterium]|nr:dioxygenase [Verrucomicrobiota bacterium]